MHIYYLDNSGFALIMDQTLLVFDYWKFPKGEVGLGFSDGYIDTSKLADYDHVYVFVSHSHGDHFNKQIFTLQEFTDNITYIVERDVVVPSTIRNVVHLETGTHAEVGTMTVYAWPSTDIGVSFQIEAAGRTIFHAGDLNYWHWQEESTPEEIEEARELYEKALDEMNGHLQTPDIAFFPVDTRMVSDIDAGALMFIERFHPQVLIPMHFQNEFETVERAVTKIRGLCKIMVPQKRGDLLSVD